MNWRLLIAIIFCFLIWSLAVKVFAHEWYSSSCCGGQDCHPIDSCSEITDSTNSSVNWNQYNFSREQIHPSQDNKCHVCIHEYEGPSGMTKRPICIYTQEGS